MKRQSTRSRASAKRRSAARAVPTGEQRGVDMGPLAEYLGHALQRARTTVFATVNKSLQYFGLSGGEFGVLVVIQRNPGLRFIDVTRALGFRETNFAPLIRGLELRGLVMRAESSADKRTKTLQITPAGDKLISAALAEQTAYEHALAARLGKLRAKRLHAMLLEIAGDESLNCE